MRCFTPLLHSSICLGPTGHRVTGKIAEAYLTKKPKKKLEQVLKGKSLAQVSTWMDEIRSDNKYDYTHDWHWVTVPDGMTYEQADKNPKGVMLLQRSKR